MKSPLQTIKAHCLDCSGGSHAEVKECRVTSCLLYAYRLGTNPNRAKKVLTEEQRDIIRKRLARKNIPESAMDSQNVGQV